MEKKFACPVGGCNCYDCERARRLGLTEDKPLLVDDRSELPWYMEHDLASGVKAPESGLDTFSAHIPNPGKADDYIKVDVGRTGIDGQPINVRVGGNDYPVRLDPTASGWKLGYGWEDIAEKLNRDWFNNIQPIDYENEGEKMRVYTGAVVQTTEEGQEIVYTSGEFLASDNEQARNIVFAAAVRANENLDPTQLTAYIQSFMRVE